MATSLQVEVTAACPLTAKRWSTRDARHERPPQLLESNNQQNSWRMAGSHRYHYRPDEGFEEETTGLPSIGPL
jgi:hypothetical protein